MIDIKTVFFLLASSHLIGAIVLLFLARGYKELTGIKEWAAGRFFVFLALCSYMSRLVMSVEVSIVLSNLLLCLGLYLALLGNYKVTGRTPLVSHLNLVIFLLLLLATLMSIGFEQSSYAARSALMGVVNAAFMLLLFKSIKPKSAEERSLGRSILMISYATLGLTECFRSVALMLTETREVDLFEVQTVTAIPMFIACCCSIITTVGYFALVVETLNRKLVIVNRQLETLSNTDALTQTLNRRSLLKKVRVNMLEEQTKATHISILFVDIDHFKAINDTYGHAFGDKVLTCVASAISSQLSKLDLLGRYGGEEFIVVLPNTMNKAAMSVAEKIRTSVKAMNLPDEVKEGVTCSVGVASSFKLHDSSSFSELLEDADIAMYHSKQNGRDRVSFYHPVMEDCKQSELKRLSSTFEL